mgnify:CR=1 FL=1
MNKATLIVRCSRIDKGRYAYAATILYGGAALASIESVTEASGMVEANIIGMRDVILDVVDSNGFDGVDRLVISHTSPDVILALNGVTYNGEFDPAAERVVDEIYDLVEEAGVEIDFSIFRTNGRNGAVALIKSRKLAEQSKNVTNDYEVSSDE